MTAEAHVRPAEGQQRACDKPNLISERLIDDLRVSTSAPKQPIAGPENVENAVVAILTLPKIGVRATHPSDWQLCS